MNYSIFSDIINVKFLHSWWLIKKKKLISTKLLNKIAEESQNDSKNFN